MDYKSRDLPNRSTCWYFYRFQQYPSQHTLVNVPYLSRKRLTAAGARTIKPEPENIVIENMLYYSEVLSANQ